MGFLSFRTGVEKQRQLLFVIILFALVIRVPSLWTEHWTADQQHYISLAKKISVFGSEKYNLRGIKVDAYYEDAQKKNFVVAPEIMKDPESKGIVLKNLENSGVFYYDLPLFHKPPGLPYLLMISNKIWAPKKNIYTIMTSLEINRELIFPGFIFIVFQFWAAIVPLFFSMCLIIITYIFGKKIFSGNVGLLAALCIASNPVDIMISQKIMPDDPLALFFSLACLVFYIGYSKNKLWLFFLSGMISGIAVLFKESGLFLIPPFWLFLILSRYSQRKNKSEWLRGVFDRRFLIWAIGCFIVCGFWFLKVYQVYGSFLFKPEQGQVFFSDTSGWFQSVMNRPHPLVLFSVGLFCISPLISCYLFSAKRFIVDMVNSFKGKAWDPRNVFLWFIIVSHILIWSSIHGNEHRRLIAVYPLMAILAANFLINDLYKGKLLKGFSKKIRAVILFCLIFLSSLLSVYLGLKYVRGPFHLILFPF